MTGPEPSAVAAAVRALTTKQQRFIDEYLVDGNATQAALRAGYSPHTAAAIGVENLNKPRLAALIADRQRVLAERAGLKALAVLEELRALCHSSVRHYVVTPDGTSLALAAAAPEAAWKAVASVKHKRREIPTKDGGVIVLTEIEYRLWDKNSALEKAMRHLGLHEPERDGAAAPGVFYIPAVVPIDPARILRVAPPEFHP